MITNCMDLMKGEPSSCSETCLMLAHCKVLGVKDKEVIHVKEEDDPEPTSPVINCEPEMEQENLQPPAQQPPAQEEQPPAQEEQPSAQEEQPPAQEEQPPAQEEQPLAQQQFSGWQRARRANAVMIFHADGTYDSMRIEARNGRPATVWTHYNTALAAAVVSYEDGTCDVTGSIPCRPDGAPAPCNRGAAGTGPVRFRRWGQQRRQQRQQRQQGQQRRAYQRLP